MKVLITTDLYTTNTNGVATSVKNLYGELTKKGHEVRIITLSDDCHSYKEGDVTYIRSMSIAVIYPNLRMTLSLRHKLIKELIEWKPDVIHSQCEFFTYQFALRISKKTGAPIVHTYHTLYEQYVRYVLPGKRFGKKIVKFLSRARLRRPKVLIAPTLKVEAALRGYGMKNEIAVVPTGINLDQHHQRITPEERLRKRRELGIEDNHRVLINLGRIAAEKNLGELIRFFEKACGEDDRLRFLIVGDGPAKNDYEKLAKKLGVSDRAIFTGMVKPNEVHEYYQLGDIFVSASTSETQGLTYIEAAANGLPLLCRRDKCLDGVVLEGENGYEYDDEESFFDIIHKIQDDAQWLESAGKRSVEIAAGFDKEAFGDAIEKIYESVIS